MIHERYWNALEEFIYDTYSDNQHRDLRVIMTLNSDNKKRKLDWFKNFFYPQSKGKSKAEKLKPFS